MYRQIDAEKRGVLKKRMTLCCSKCCVLNVKTISYDTWQACVLLCQESGVRRASSDWGSVAAPVLIDRTSLRGGASIDQCSSPLCARTMDNYGGVPGGLNQGHQPGVRPKVDPEALGEVDPEMYGQPKEATHKIRGKSDILELLCGDVDQELLTVKTFYFFFYSAFGSLFPLMGVYFKQMGMNPGQCGLLIGSRPFVEFLAAPFWGSLADR